MPLKSLLRRLTSTPAAAAPEVTKDTLFPAVDPGADADGADCQRDCDSCPAAAGYGRAFDRIGVDTTDRLFGRCKAYATHAVVATGESDWIRDVEDIKGSVMRALAARRPAPARGRLMISASNLPVDVPDTPHPDGPAVAVVLVPQFVVVEGVRPRDVDALVSEYVDKGASTEDPLDEEEEEGAEAEEEDPLDEEEEEGAEAEEEEEEKEKEKEEEREKEKEKEKEEEKEAADEQEKEKDEPAPPPDPAHALARLSLSAGPLRATPYPHDFLLLLCSHRRRDARCGISAPILRKEFERQLAPLGLWRDLADARPGGAKVVFVNHVGGHKYSANLIIYRKRDGQGIWLARVLPKHVEGIIKYTLLQGKLVHPDMLRGGFNRREGLVSW